MTRSTSPTRWAVVAAALAFPVASSAQNSAPTPDIGVVVMAHGGTAEWNESIIAATRPVAASLPTAIAFGMADPETMSEALARVHDAGVTRVVVVRLFLSGGSFLPETRFLLGMDDAPTTSSMPAHEGGHSGHSGHSGPLVPIEHAFQIATHLEGMVDGPEATRVFAERAAEHSVDPSSESVLLIAHGQEDEHQNDELLAAMARIEAQVAVRNFHTVRSATLREDWPEARATAEAEIRAFVAAEAGHGRRVIVVPVRLSGFGPYAEVLDGLDYVAAEAFLPHSAVGEWIQRMVAGVAEANGWSP